LRLASVRSRTARVMTALMRNGRDRRLGEPVMGHAIFERVRLFGILVQRSMWRYRYPDL